MKTKPQSQRQIDYIFSFPLSFPSLATINFRGVVPTNFDILNVSIDRGGNANPHTIMLSMHWDQNKRVLGIRVWDPVAKIFKEDHREYDSTKNLVRIFPKGEYQIYNPAYRNTHHIT